MAYRQRLLDRIAIDAERRACKARQVSDQMSCDRCGLVWDINDPEPPECRAEQDRDAARLAALDDIREKLK